MNLKEIACNFFCQGTVIILGITVSFSITVLAAQNSNDPRFRGFLCNNFWQNRHLKRITVQYYLERCTVPAIKYFEKPVVEPANRLLKNLPILHSLEFGEVKAETSEKQYCPNTKQLKISRKGKVYINEFLSSRFTDTWITKENEEYEGSCDFYNIGLDQIKDLDGDLEPEILVGYHTKGAHCCSGLLVYYYVPNSDEYKAIVHYFGEWGYQESEGLKDLDGDKVLEFNVLDDSLFSDYKVGIESIWQYRQGQMYDVTRSFPDYLRQSASRVLQDYADLEVEYKEKFIGRGLLTSYMAYKYLLSESEEGWKKVKQVYIGEDREEFLNAIKMALQRLGYIPVNHIERVNLKSESNINNSIQGLHPNRKRRHAIAVIAGKQLTVKLRDIAFEKGTVEIRLFSPEGRLLGVIDRYKQRHWQKKIQSSGDYVIEVYSPTGTRYSLEFNVV